MFSQSRTSESSLGQVLVVDDCDVARATMCEALREAGFSVLEHCSAIGATRTLFDNEIRAVVVDIRMPGLSGDKFVPLLRSNPKLKDLVIVLVSAKSEAELNRVAREGGANAGLSKEHVADRLAPLLLRLLGIPDDAAKPSPSLPSSPLPSSPLPSTTTPVSRRQYGPAREPHPSAGRTAESEAVRSSATRIAAALPLPPPATRMRGR